MNSLHGYLSNKHFCAIKPVTTQPSRRAAHLKINFLHCPGLHFGISLRHLYGSSSTAFERLRLDFDLWPLQPFQLARSTILFYLEVNMAQVLRSQKGKPQLGYRGYSYLFQADGHEKKIWICTENRRHDCLGRLHTAAYIPAHGETVEVIKDSSNHNHTPDAASIEKTRVLNNVKMIAASSMDSTSSVVATAIAGSSIACLGKNL